MAADLPFAKPLSAPQAASHSGAARSSRGRHDGAGDNRLRGKTCHLCDDGDCGPGYDLWHVLFECSATSEHPEIVAVCKSCVDFVPQLCDSIQNAVRLNGASMSNTEHAGVSHKDIVDAATDDLLRPEARTEAMALRNTAGFLRVRAHL